MSKLKDWLNPGKWFPTEEERYKNYLLLLLVLKFATLCVLVSGLFYVVFGSGWYTFWNCTRIVLRIFVGLLLFYIFYKGKVWHFLLRGLPCLALSLFLMIMATVFVGPLCVPLVLLLSVFVNRKRFKIYARYKNYCWYILATLAITGGVAIAFVSGRVPGTFDNRVLAFFVTMIPFFLLWMLLKHEVEGGRSFVEAMRIMALITPSFLLCLWAFLTVVPVKYFSGQSLFGEDGHDYLALPQG